MAVQTSHCLIHSEMGTAARSDLETWTSFQENKYQELNFLIIWYLKIISQGSAPCINPLSFNSEQHQFSRNNFHFVKRKVYENL